MQNFKDEIFEKQSIATHFDFYLEKMDLKQSEISDVQYIETRRAFYGGFIQSLVFSIESVRFLSQGEYSKIMTDFMNEAREFLSKEKNLL